VQYAKAMVALADPGALRAALSWPKFSLTSYSMVSGLVRQGVLPRTVLDVGANVGQFAVAAAKLFPGVTVHSFEPLPSCLDRLRRNVARLPNVVVYPLAVGDHNGEVTMHLNSYDLSSSALRLGAVHKRAFPGGKEIGEIQAPLNRLDSIINGVDLQTPVLLKVDVQGLEPQVIHGAEALLSQVDYVVLETSFKPLYEGEHLFRDITQLMEENGFTFLRPVGWLEAPGSGEILQMDALFVRSDHAAGV
jgi:FkbM family methyltransferase